MFSSQALTVAGRRRGIANGFRGFGDLSNSITYTANDIRQIQNALNGQPTYLARLAVDGVLGPKTIERIREFQSIAGYPVTGSLQPALLIVLGLSSGGGAVTSPGAGAIGAVGAGVGSGGGNGGSSPGVWDYIASIFSPITGAPSVVAAATGDMPSATVDAINEAKAVVKAGTEGTQAAMKFLADNGDLFAKGALVLGVSYGVAQAIALGGGGFLLIMLLKKR